jgi:predicted secreted protein
MPVQKVAGKSGSLTYNSQTLNFSKWTAKVNRDLADSTDSVDYDPVTDMLWKSQIPISNQIEVDVEGFFDLNSTDTTLLTPLFSGTAAVPVVLKITPTHTFGHGNFDLSNFQVEVPVDGIVKFSGSMKSSSIFVPLA